MAAALHTSIHDGIDVQAVGTASVAGRQAAFGANRFKEVPPKNFLALWFGNLQDPTILMLMAAALVRDPTILMLMPLRRTLSTGKDGNGVVTAPAAAPQPDRCFLAALPAWALQPGLALAMAMWWCRFPQCWE